jgi:hypothetical protein
MATKANAKQPSGQSSGNRGGGSGFYVPPAFDVVDKPDEEGYAKLLIVLVCLMLVLPLFLYLMVSMYFDMLLLKQEIKQQQAIVRRLLIKDEK